MVDYGKAREVRNENNSRKVSNMTKMKKEELNKAFVLGYAMFNNKFPKVKISNEQLVSAKKKIITENKEKISDLLEVGDTQSVASLVDKKLKSMYVSDTISVSADGKLRTDITAEKVYKDAHNGVIRFRYTHAASGIDPKTGKHKEDRYVYATLDPHLCTLYDNSKRSGKANTFRAGKPSHERPSNKPTTVVHLVDLEAGMLKAFLVSNICADSPDGTSYATCDIDNDAWYKAMTGEEKASDLIVGDKFALTKPSQAREQHELKLAQEAMENGALFDPETAIILENISELSNKALRVVANNLAHHVLPAEIRKLTDTGSDFRGGYQTCVRQPLKEMQKDTKNVFNGATVASKIQEVPTVNSAYYVKLGTDTVFFHPYYAINMRTGNIIYDITGILHKSKVGAEMQALHDKLPEIVCRFEKEFNPLFEDLVKFAKLDELPVPKIALSEKVSKTFQRRLDRLNMVTAYSTTQIDDPDTLKVQYSALVHSFGVVKMTPVSENQSVQVVFKFNNRKLVFEINPNFLIFGDLKKGQPEVIVHTKKECRALSDWREGIAIARKKYKGDAEMQQALHNIEDLFVKRIFNLKVTNLTEYKGNH